MDIIDNKKTILMITALKDANKDQKEKLMYWLTADNFDPKEKVKSVVEIFDALDIKTKTNKMIRQYYDESLENLKALNRPDEDKTELFSFADLLINRKK